MHLFLVVVEMSWNQLQDKLLEVRKMIKEILSAKRLHNIWPNIELDAMSATRISAQNVMQNFGKGGKGGGPFGGQMGKMFETMMQSGMSSGMDEEEMNIFQNAQSIINNGGGNAQALQTQYNRKQAKDRLRAKLEEKKRMLEEKERELAEKAKMQADYEANVDLDA